MAASAKMGTVPKYFSLNLIGYLSVSFFPGSIGPIATLLLCRVKKTGSKLIFESGIPCSKAFCQATYSSAASIGIGPGSEGFLSTEMSEESPAFN